MMVSVGFTGTQRGMTPAQKGLFLDVLKDLEIFNFRHGDCIGADADAHNLVRMFDSTISIAIHPPIDERKRAFMKGDIYYSPNDYLTRNHQIVDLCDVLIATPGEYQERIRSGTWATIRYARRQMKKIITLFPVEQCPPAF